MEQAIYCSTDTRYKSPFGALPLGQSVAFTLRVPKDMGVSCPRLYLIYDTDPAVEYKLDKSGTDKDHVIFHVSLIPERTGAYFYWFDLYVDYKKLYRGFNGECVMTTDNGEPYQLYVYQKDYSVPEWIKGGVMYQIFPDRFCDVVEDKVMPFSDRVHRKDKNGEPYFWPTELPEGHLNHDYYGGDFEGIKQKLPYLSGLGVTCIYLNPIFEAHSNHRYNTADYMRPDPLLGSVEDFKDLCAAAKEHGINIILDGVFSHTGDDSVYFDRNARYGRHGAYHSIDSPYRSWYKFSREFPFGYKCWWGFATLPEVDETNPHYIDFICGKKGVIAHWMALGAAGFRLDVADELPDEFIENIRKAVKRADPQGYLIGEVWEDASIKVSYEGRRKYLNGGHLDSVMNYPFRGAVIEFVKSGSSRYAADGIMRIVENYPAPALDVAMNFLSNHDTVRILTELAGDNLGDHDRYWQSGRVIAGDRLRFGKQLVRLAYAMLFTLPGVPSVYYGDEVYMQGYKDPFNRAFYNWEEQDNTLRDTIKTLSHLRESLSAFKDGKFELVDVGLHTLSYHRYNDDCDVLVIINRSKSLRSVMYKGKSYEALPYNFLIKEIK